MLNYTTILPLTLNLLRRIQENPSFKDFALVGGTSLALQIGHRMSIDLDFFRHSNSNIEDIIEDIRELGASINITNQSNRILNLVIDDVKVDFVSYGYPFIENPIIEENLILASTKDIAAMKLSAISKRGSKKDFIDLYYLLDQYSLAEMLKFYTVKYQDNSEFLVIKSLTYFMDAESDPMPKMMNNIKWDTIKSRIKTEVESFMNNA